MRTALAGILILFCSVAWGDLMIFHNGDHLYGEIINPDATQEMIITVNGVDHLFKRSQVRNIHVGIQPPAAGEILRATDFIQSSTGEILSITASNITARKSIKNKDREIVIDVENGFDVSAIQLYPTTYSFFSRQGSYLVAFLRNLGDKPWAGATFRIFLYNQQNHLLGTRDFYVFRLPPVDQNGRGGRRIEVEIPDVTMNQIHRIRFVRRF